MSKSPSPGRWRRQKIIERFHVRILQSRFLVNFYFLFPSVFFRGAKKGSRHRIFACSNRKTGVNTRWSDNLRWSLRKSRFTRKSCARELMLVLYLGSGRISSESRRIEIQKVLVLHVQEVLCLVCFLLCCNLPWWPKQRGKTFWPRKSFMTRCCHVIVLMRWYRSIRISYNSVIFFIKSKKTQKIN